jgi:transcription elongation factor GreA
VVEKEPMTEITYNRLSVELENLKTKERANIAKEIESALELGDLKENSEYHTAKDKQGLMEARIIELQDVVGRAIVIDPSKLAHKRVSFGSTIFIIDTKTEEEITYTIVGTQESNPNKGLISIKSPLAKQILGKEEGDSVKINLPSGKVKYDIEEVYYKEIDLS